MDSYRSLLRAVPALVLSLAAFSAEAPGAQHGTGVSGGVAPAAGITVEAPSTLRAGPVVSDPVDRERIAELELEVQALHRDLLEQLADLNLRAAGADPATLRALQDEGAAMKEATRVRHIELCLEIASVQGDAAQVAELQEALAAEARPAAAGVIAP